MRYRLTADLVTRARYEAASGVTVAAIARQIEVPYQTVRHAVAGETWQGIADVPPHCSEAHRKSGRRRLTDEDVRWVRGERRRGATYASIAAELGVAPGTVWNVANGVTYQAVRDHHVGVDEVPDEGSPQPL